ncbi:hypothetical protein CAEBREN_08148 [Caenorhabditis brenneri]|uniref:DNA2/NAM7 helicase-like C-terminal domain-containing protein n=1 Tax=Caenorhabditis brenneri TaxID=135651 RepID=G0MWG4_CAEBE|nr:hypothetical protein CAEBREN_08148 [Caenorhabditis brenneri]
MDDPPAKRLRSLSPIPTEPSHSANPSLHLTGPCPAVTSSPSQKGPSPAPEENYSENSSLININDSRSTISNTEDYMDFIDALIPTEPSSAKIGPMPSPVPPPMEIDDDQDDVEETNSDPDAHPFEQHYTNNNDALPEDPARKIAASATLEAIQKFRRETMIQTQIPTEKTKGTNGCPNKFLNATNQPQPDGVLYVLQETSGNGTYMVPLHKEVVANDRPDLFMLQMTQKSKDRLNEGPPCMKNFYPGDLVYVFSLQRRPDAVPYMLKKDFKALGDPKEHKFWNVNEFCLVERTMKKNQLLLIQDSEAHLRSAECVAAGVNQMVRAPFALIKQAGISKRNGTLAWATIFQPPFDAGKLLRGIIPGKSKHFVTRATDCQPVVGPSPPVVTQLQSVSASDQEKIRSCPRIFQVMNPRDPVALDVLVTTARFGLSAALALENKDRDHRTYATTIDKARDTRKGQLIDFSISKPSGLPSLSSWCRNVSFTMELQNGTRIGMEVDNATEDGGAILVSARPSHSSRNQVPLSQALLNQNIVVSQPVENNLHQLRAMPMGADFQRIDQSSKAMALIYALAGGGRIDPVETPTETIQLGDLILSEEQSRYVSLLVNKELPAVLANSPFGVGKTLMIVAGARIAAIRSDKEQALQALTGVTNASVVAMVQAYLNQDKENSGRAVRLISEPNRARQIDSLHTSLDASVLWPTEFLKFLHKTDAGLAPNEEVSKPQLVEAVMYHLRAHGLLREVTLHNKMLKKMASSKLSRDQVPDLFTVFFRLYRPKIIFATSATLIEQFRNGDWSIYVNWVETLQIDEASQTPWYSLLSLAALFPKAKIGLIGDHHQLSPHSHVDMPSLCKEVAIGNLLQRAAERNLVPAVDVTVVYRCTKEVTQLISSLAYGGKLVPKRGKEPRHRLLDALLLSSSFPIQVLDLKSNSLPSGTSQVNKEEAELTAGLVRAIIDSEKDHERKSTIGVLCFYKGQSGLVGALLEDEDVFVNTIDASQGQEFDVTIVLTSYSGPFSNSPFLGDANRFVVATTRAKHLCLVVANQGKAATAGVWRRFFDLLPKEAINTVEVNSF